MIKPRCDIFSGTLSAEAEILLDVPELCGSREMVGMGVADGLPLQFALTSIKINTNTQGIRFMLLLRLDFDFGAHAPAQSLGLFVQLDGDRKDHVPAYN